MPEPAAHSDPIEQANQQFWNPPSLDDLMADIEPLKPNEQLDIADLTDEEWDAFERALAE
jgi:hypothetical protein